MKRIAFALMALVISHDPASAQRNFAADSVRINKYYLVSVSGDTILEVLPTKVYSSKQMGIGTRPAATNMLHVYNQALGGPVVTVESAQDGAVGPSVIQYLNTVSPAASDIIGQHIWNSKDQAGFVTTYGSIHAEIRDATDGSEKGALVFSAIVNGAQKSLTYENGNFFWNRTQYFDPVAFYSPPYGYSGTAQGALLDTAANAVEEIYVFPDTTTGTSDLWLRTSFEQHVNSIDSIEVLVSCATPAGDSVRIGVGLYDISVGEILGTSLGTGYITEVDTDLGSSADSLISIMTTNASWQSQFSTADDFVWVSVYRDQVVANNVAAFVRFHGIKIYYH